MNTYFQVRSAVSRAHGQKSLRKFECDQVGRLKGRNCHKSESPSNVKKFAKISLLAYAILFHSFVIMTVTTLGWLDSKKTIDDDELEMLNPSSPTNVVNE